MLMMQEANRRSEESTKTLKEAGTFKMQIEELKKENAQMKYIITKSMQAEYQAENAQPAEDEVEQNIREIMHETTIHFDPARSKIGDQVTRQVNLGKAVDDYSNRDVPMDWEKK